MLCSIDHIKVKYRPHQIEGSLTSSSDINALMACNALGMRVRK